MDTSRVYFKGLLNLKIDQAFFEDKDEKALRFYMSSLEKLETLLYQYKTLHIFKVSLQRHKLGTGRISEDFIKKVIGKQTSEKTIVGAFTYTSVTPELKYETNIFFLTVGESLSKPYAILYETFKGSRASKLTSQFGISAPMYHDLAYSVRDTVELFKQLSIFEGLKGDLRERGFYRVKFYSTLPLLGGSLISHRKMSASGSIVGSIAFSIDSKNSTMSKPFFSGFLDYVPNYDLHPNEFDQELFHESLEFLTDALYARGVVQPYVLTTTSRCSSIAQIIDDYIVSIRAISGETFMGAYTSIIQQLNEDRHHAEILLLRDTSLHERNSYSEFLLELWDNLLYTDSTLHVKALDCVSVVDKIGLSSFIERLRQTSRTEEGQFSRPPSIRKQYRVRSYTEQHQATPRQRKHKPNFNARESFLKMVDALRKVHQKV